MTASRSLPLALKALRQLGIPQVGLFAGYQLQLCSGYLRWLTYRELRQAWKVQVGQQKSLLSPISDLFELPGKESLTAILSETDMLNLTQEADEIAAGRVRLFGGDSVPLRLQPAAPLVDWDEYERSSFGVSDKQAENDDIKFTWEPARFGWVFILGRAYRLTADERYPAAFWKYWEQFLDANPSFKGPNWTSAQEVAFRILAFVFAAHVFAGSPQTTPVRSALLAEFTAAHAARIPATMLYGRAQNNNHLLSEAAGLFTAGLAFRGHPKAARWRELGWKWFNQGLKSQIAKDGAYVQHSTNYHRLMLQLALWVGMLAKSQGWLFPQAAHERLVAATRWLANLVDPEGGKVPNLGPNDSANILPLSTCPFADYRPVLQAASSEFLGQRLLPGGAWDEMGYWLGERVVKPQVAEPGRTNVSNGVSGSSSPEVLRTSHSWGYLRATRFSSRPGHADQLHLDLWWRGENVALDAGTYLYNAPPPWDNTMARTAVHNTLNVNSQDQMTRAGRFLWLDWAQARLLARERAEDGSWLRLVAEHSGYRRMGVIHRRSVTAYLDDHWLVVDSLVQDPAQQLTPQAGFRICLHWLLPDLPWELFEKEDEARLELVCPYGLVRLKVRGEEGVSLDSWQGTRLVRAGELLRGTMPETLNPEMPVSGWYSPNYGVKLPALSFSIEMQGCLPLRLDSEWTFVNEQD